MTRRRITRPFVILALAMGILLGSPGVANAASSSTHAYTYMSWQDCAWNHTQLSTDYGGRPTLWSTGTMDWTNGYSQCGNMSYQAGPYGISLKQNLMYWQSGTWMICPTAAPWVQNTTFSHSVSTSFTWAIPPCGSQYYRSWGDTQTWNNAWHSWGPVFGNAAIVVN